MKRTLSIIVLAVCSVVMTALLVPADLGRHDSQLLPQCWLLPQLVADGGEPAPLRPQPTAVLVADGGAPAPPWPGSPTARRETGGPAVS
jgi:hypothetical protein